MSAKPCVTRPKLFFQNFSKLSICQFSVAFSGVISSQQQRCNWCCHSTPPAGKTQRNKEKSQPQQCIRKLLPTGNGLENSYLQHSSRSVRVKTLSPATGREDTVIITKILRCSGSLHETVEHFHITCSVPIYSHILSNTKKILGK